MGCRIVAAWMVVLCACLVPAHGAPTSELESIMARLTDGDSGIRRVAMIDLARTGDPRLEAFFEAYRTRALYSLAGRIVFCDELIQDADDNDLAPLSDPLSREPLLKDGQPLVIPVDDLKEIGRKRKDRRLASQMKHLVRLSSVDPKLRFSAAKKCAEPVVLAATNQLTKLSQTDPELKIRRIATESMLLIQASGLVPGQALQDKLAAVKALGERKSLRSASRLSEELALLEAATGADAAPESIIVYKTSLRQIANHQTFVDSCSNVLQGLSLGSVLILMALGLAITFGLMGVINMAHGELLMLGAYATYEMQRLFVWLIETGRLEQGAYDWYYVAAFPVAFLTAAVAGGLIELLVVRHLYRRPLESLLATWGVGLILIQAVRIRYGDNIGVNAPEWARGSVEILQDVQVPFARIFIIVLCIVCVLVIYALMNHTTLGLRIRATMQGRDMARSLGVNARRIDLYTFAFGAGLAGIAGYAVTLISGVTPDMGQQVYIVDSFLVVVTGGLGELIGVIYAGLGIGVLTKAVEPITGTIWAKILLLIAVVIFIRFRPTGLIAPKGRLSDV